MTNYRALVPGGFYSSNPHGADPVSIRDNNAGAVNGAGWERIYPGYVTEIETTAGNHTTVFETPEHGVAVWWELMRRYANGGARTIEQIIIKYGGEDQIEKYRVYLNVIVGWCGLPKSTVINLDDDVQLLRFAKAMFRYEAGKPTPLSDEQILFGFAFARYYAKTGKQLEYVAHIAAQTPPAAPAAPPAPRGFFAALLALFRRS